MKYSSMKRITRLIIAVMLVAIMGTLSLATVMAKSTIDTDKKGTLTINKYLGAEGDTSTTLDGVVFTYLKVADMDQITIKEDTRTVSVVAFSNINADFKTKLGLGEADYTVDGNVYYSLKSIQEKLATASDMKGWITSNSGTDMPATVNGTSKVENMDLGLYVVVETVYPATTT